MSPCYNVSLLVINTFTHLCTNTLFFNCRICSFRIANCKYNVHLCFTKCFHLFCTSLVGLSWSWSYGSWIYKLLVQSLPIMILKLWVRNPCMARCTRYNIMWYSLSVIRICKSKKNRQHNGQKKKDKSTNNYLQTTTKKTEDRVTLTLLKTGGELRYSGIVSSSCSTSGTHRVTLVTNPVTSQERGKDREVFTTSGTYPWSLQWQIKILKLLNVGH